MVLAWVPTVGDSCLSLRLESYANTIKLLNYKPSLPGYMTGFLKPCSSQCGPCSRYKSQAPLPVAHWVRITRFSNCCVCARITPCQTYAKSDPGQLSSCLCQGFGLNKSGEGAMYFSTLCNHLRPATLVCRLHFKWHPPESFGWQTWGGGWVVP